MVVVHSNSIALEYNRTIRERRWGDAGMPIQIGETLLVNKNKPPFSNGDLVRVMKVGAEPKKIVVPLRGGHRVDISFREVSLAFRDTDGTIVKHDTLIRASRDDIFVPPDLAKGFETGQTYDVCCLAVRRQEKTGKIGWRAVRVSSSQIK